MKLNVTLGVLALLQIAASLIVQMAVLRIVGAGTATDVYVAAQAVPAVLLSIISVSLQAVWQPRLAVISNDHAIWRMNHGVAQGQVLIALGGPVLLLMLTARLWLTLLFPGFGALQVQMVLSMTFPILISCLLSGHISMMTTAFRSQGRFVVSEVVSLTAIIISLGVIFLIVPAWGIESVPWIMLMRTIIVSGILYVMIDLPRINLRAAFFDRKAWAQMRPTLAGSSLYKTAPLLDRFWASQSPSGGMTIYNLAQLGISTLVTVIDRAICVPVTPQFARFVDAGDWVGLRVAYRRTLMRITWSSGAMLIALLLAKPFWNDSLELLLRLSLAMSEGAWLISIALLGYMYGAVSGSLIVSAFYAMGDAHTPVKVGVLGFFVGISLKSLGFILLGLPGLAMATSVYYVCNMVATLIILERKIGERIS